MSGPGLSLWRFDVQAVVAVEARPQLALVVSSRMDARTCLGMIEGLSKTVSGNWSLRSENSEVTTSIHRHSGSPTIRSFAPPGLLVHVETYC